MIQATPVSFTKASITGAPSSRKRKARTAQASITYVRGEREDAGVTKSRASLQGLFHLLCVRQIPLMGADQLAAIIGKISHPESLLAPVGGADRYYSLIFCSYVACHSETCWQLALAAK